MTAIINKVALLWATLFVLWRTNKYEKRDTECNRGNR